MPGDSQAAAARSHNADAWNRRAARGERFSEPAEDALFADPLAALDAGGWLGGSVAGRRVLCLAAGGGRHGPLFAAAGAAEVVVVDASSEQLAVDRQVAERRRLSVQTVLASMDDLGALAQGRFDVVSQPVSTCYLPDVQAIYREVARVTSPGGVYLSQHKHPVSLQTSVEPGERGYEIVERYYRSGPLPEVAPSKHREAGSLEFLHRLEELLGGLCRAGFVIEDVVEPLHADAAAARGSFGHRSRFAPPYLRIKARRLGEAGDRIRSGAQLFIPE